MPPHPSARDDLASAKSALRESWAVLWKACAAQRLKAKAAGVTKETSLCAFSKLPAPKYDITVCPKLQLQPAIKISGSRAHTQVLSSPLAPLLLLPPRLCQALDYRGALAARWCA